MKGVQELYLDGEKVERIPVMAQGSRHDVRVVDGIAQEKKGDIDMINLEPAAESRDWRRFYKGKYTASGAGPGQQNEERGVTEQGIVMGYDRRFLQRSHAVGGRGICSGTDQGIPDQQIIADTACHVLRMKHDFPYGMMITASHNPAIYNGIKVFTAGGRDADEIQTKDLEDYIADIASDGVCAVAYEDGKAAGYIEEIYPLNEYIDNIIASVDMKAIRDADLKVALDPMYGVSETSLKTILLTARCEVATIHDRHDTLFGGKLPAPSAATLHSLQNYVVEKQCDIGIATDGDADRIGVIDDKGNFLHPNDILVLLYYYLVKFKGWHGPVVRNIATTHMLDKVAEQFGEKCYEVPVEFWVCLR